MQADDLSSVTQSHQDDLLSSSDGSSEGDTGAILTAPPVLGRDSEKLVLLEAYQRVSQTQESQVVFVHGTSGQGKTTLIDTLRKPVCQRNGYFCSGKFFQNSEIQEPFSAITSAFSDLCDLVVQSPEFDEKLPEFDVQAQNRIQEFLATHGHLLSRSVNLSPLFSGANSMDLFPSSNSCADNVSNSTRFRGACKAFLLAMASKKHPVVLFIDDVQWMDSGSTKLLDLMKDDDIKNVMLVFSYRDEEASAVEELLQSYKGGRVTDIQLSNLDLAGVSQILAWRLEPLTDNLEELSELTFQRTGGNPFFVSLFLDAIATEEFLSTNEENPTFDVDKIRSEIMVADGIADLLSQKVCRLPVKIRHILTVASLIGYSFDEKVLFEVPDIVKTPFGKKRNEEVAAMLTRAVGEGFIEESQGSYQFTHDKLQKTFQDLIDEPTRERLHQAIGEMYLEQDDDGSIYNAAVHLNVAPGFLFSKEQRIVLAQINLDASRYCQQLSAFDRASFLLCSGIELLNEIKMKWSAEVFALSLGLTESLARVALLVGDFDTCNTAVEEAMLHVDTKEQKVNILLINVECRMAKNEMKASIRASTEALLELGVKLPRKATMRHVVFKFTKLKWLMAGKPDEHILGLPCVNDVSWALAIRLLMHISFYSHLTDHQEAPGAHAALLAMELTLKHGLSTYAAPALTIFGVAVLRMGNISRAYTLGKLALKLLERSPSRDGDCPTLGFAHTLLLHWREPMYHIHHPLTAAATAGFGKGDVIYSSYCLSHAIGMAILSGIPLEGVEKSIQSQYVYLHDLGQGELLEWLRPYMQLVANLRSSSTDWCQLSLLSGDFMHSTEPSSEAASDNIMVTMTTLVNKLLLAITFGSYDLARKTLATLEFSANAIIQSVYAFYAVCWGAGVAHYEGFIADRDRKHLRKAREYTKYLKQRHSLGPNGTAFLKHLNLQQQVLLRQSRRRRTDGTDVMSRDDDETLRLLDCELETFSLSKGPSSCTPCFVVARAYLDAGSVAERMGHVGKALEYYERASEIYYEDWGAFAPAAWVEEKRKTLLRRTQHQETACNTPDLLVGGMVQFGEDGEATYQECAAHRSK